MFVSNKYNNIYIQIYGFIPFFNSNNNLLIYIISVLRTIQ